MSTYFDDFSHQNVSRIIFPSKCSRSGSISNPKFWAHPVKNQTHNRFSPLNAPKSNSPIEGTLDTQIFSSRPIYTKSFGCFAVSPQELQQPRQQQYSLHGNTTKATLKSQVDSVLPFGPLGPRAAEPVPPSSPLSPLPDLCSSKEPSHDDEFSVGPGPGPVSTPIEEHHWCSEVCGPSPPKPQNYQTGCAYVQANPKPLQTPNPKQHRYDNTPPKRS